MRDEPLLVATDPVRMVKPLLAKDGPAERRAQRLAGEPVKALCGFSRQESRERTMRANLGATRLSLRINRLGLLAERAGTIFCTPGHEGTSAGCPACDRVRKKDLRERGHDCPCGLSLPRDQASAIETLGRALLPFRLSPDPGGAIAARLAERAEARETVLEERRKLAERSRAAAERRKATTMQTAGASPGHQGVVLPGPRPTTPKRVRGQGRNVRRPGQQAGCSN